MGEKFGPEWTIPDRAVLLVIVCVYEQKNIYYKITWNQQDFTYVDQNGRGDSPLYLGNVTCNSLREIYICLFVTPPYYFTYNSILT